MTMDHDTVVVEEMGVSIRPGLNRVLDVLHLLPLMFHYLHIKNGISEFLEAFMSNKYLRKSYLPHSITYFDTGNLESLFASEGVYVQDLQRWIANFGFTCPKLDTYVNTRTRTDADIRIAVDTWYNDSVTAQATYGHIRDWITSDVTNMSGLFTHAITFNEDISSWDVSAVTNMNGMFVVASAFNGDLSAWNVSAVTDMGSMFCSATAFNGDISLWNVSAVTDMRGMFCGATTFNRELSAWNVSAVTNMDQMFRDAVSFDSDLSLWIVSAVTDMCGMFDGATTFNRDISSWNVSAVTDMRGIFRGATAFNSYLHRTCHTYQLMDCICRHRYVWHVRWCHYS